MCFVPLAEPKELSVANSLPLLLCPLDDKGYRDCSMHGGIEAKV